MLQEIFRIPGTNISVHGYGLMLVIAFLLAVQLARFLARRSNIDPEALTNAALIALVTGVIGSRLSHVLENFHQYTDPARSAFANFKDAINITSGGLTYYGGFILATPCTIAYGIYKKIPLRVGMDVFAPCIMLGLALGRVGCFLNGCCYGEECSVPWGVQFPYDNNAYLEQVQHGEIKPAPEMYTEVLDANKQPIQHLMSVDEVRRAYRNEPGKADQLMNAERAKVHKVHPAEIYSTITALIIAAVLLAFYTLPHVPGHGFALMCILEGMTRFMLEMLRVEPPIGLSMSLSMWIGISLVVAGALLWITFNKAGGLLQGGADLQPAVA